MQRPESNKNRHMRLRAGSLRTVGFDTLLASYWERRGRHRLGEGRRER